MSGAHNAQQPLVVSCRHELRDRKAEQVNADGITSAEGTGQADLSIDSSTNSRTINCCLPIDVQSSLFYYNSNYNN